MTPPPVAAQPVTTQPVAPPPATDSPAADVPVTPPDTDPTRFHFNGRGTLATGVAVGSRIDFVSFGDPSSDPRSHGHLIHGTGFLAPWVRVVGYAERKAKRGSPLFFILPDIALTFQLGGSRVLADQTALDNGHDVYRRGTYIGLLGHASFAGGVASSGRFGGYAKGSVGARYLIGGASKQGAYGLFPVGVGFGLRVAVRPEFTVLVGPKVDAVFGVQGINGAPGELGEIAPGAWSTLAQLAPGGDLVLQAKTAKNIYFSLLGTADVTALGRQYGGQRIFGRAGIDATIPMTDSIRLAVFATYTGWRATAAPDTPPFAAEGQTWQNHTFLIGLGVGL